MSSVIGRKLLHFASLVARRPTEAYGHFERLVDSQLDRRFVEQPNYRTDHFQRVIDELGEVWHRDLSHFLEEPALKEIEEEVQTNIDNLSSEAPFALDHNGDFCLARLCYVLCRALVPKNAIETGVCYGVTSSFLLKAMDVNGLGELHSVDMPPLADEGGELIGGLIPPSVRGRWHLYRGTSRWLLPRILRQVAPLDFFLHDSLHTYRNMKRELKMITPHLARPAVVISDDIEGNPAFLEWSSRACPDYAGVVKVSAKSGLLGVALLRASADSLQSELLGVE